MLEQTQPLVMLYTSVEVALITELTLPILFMHNYLKICFKIWFRCSLKLSYKKSAFSASSLCHFHSPNVVLTLGEVCSHVLLLEQCYCIAGNAFFPTGESKTIGGGSLHTYLLSGKMQMLCQMGTHRLYVRGQFGVFCDDRCIDVVDHLVLLT